jgi:phosphotransacetylase
MNQVKSFSDLHDAAREKAKLGKTLKMGAVALSEKKELEAIIKAVGEGLITPVFIGNKSSIHRAAKEANLDIGKYEIIDSSAPETDALAAAKEQEVDFLLTCGGNPSPIFAAGVKEGSGWTGKGDNITHIALLQAPKYHKIFYVSDGVCSQINDLGQRVKVVENAAALARILGVAIPKVALLAAVEAISPSVPVTLDGAVIAKMADRGQIKNIIADGPLSFDCAMSDEIAKHKGIKNSQVTGDADIFAAPSQETADGLFKAIVMFGGAGSAGIFFGGKFPIVTAFEINSAEDIFNSIALGVCVSLK